MTHVTKFDVTWFVWKLSKMAAKSILLQRTKLVLRNIEKATSDEIADIVGAEISEDAGNNFRGNDIVCLSLNLESISQPYIIAHLFRDAVTVL